MAQGGGPDLEHEGRLDAVRCQVWAWLLLAILLTPIPLAVAGRWGPLPAGGAAAAVALAAAAIVGFLPLAPLTAGPRRRIGRLPPARELHNLVDAALIRRGELPVGGGVTVHTVEAQAPNVGAFPAPGGGLVVFATTGADAALNRAELETLVFAQISMARDPWARRAARATAVARAVPVAAALGLVITVPVLIATRSDGGTVPQSAAAGTALAAFGALGGCIAAAILGLLRAPYLDRRRAAAADAAAARMTVNPPALVSALDRLSRSTASRLRLGWSARADPFLTVTVAANSTTTVNGRKRTTASEAAAVLRARAGRVATWTGVPYRSGGTVEEMEADWTVR